jgi:hypothetical protein
MDGQFSVVGKADERICRLGVDLIKFLRMKQHFNAIIFAVAAITVAIIFSGSYKNRHRSNDIISVTGLGSRDFSSDLIVWEASYSGFSSTLRQASSEVDSTRAVVRKYLVGKGISPKEIVFSSVDINKEFRNWYDNENKHHSEFVGYRLGQTLTIESHEVEKVEQVSREVTELISQGIEVQSSAPQYYYTKLAELKIEMVAAATEDARMRAEQIAKNSGANLGDLRYAQMGVFQITAQNSSEDYSWGGSFNTRSKHKTASITMKLQFGVD